MRRTIILVMLVAALAAVNGCCRRSAQATGSVQTTSAGVSAQGAIQPSGGAAVSAQAGAQPVVSRYGERPLAQARAGERVTAKVQKDMLVSTDWLANHRNDRDLVVIQVGRDRAAYDSGHIPGALFVSTIDLSAGQGTNQAELPPMNRMVGLVRQLGLDYNNRIILYSDDGGISAARMYVALDYLGLGYRTAMLDGQIQKWCVENRPMSTVEPQVTASTFVPVVNPNVLIAFPQVEDIAWTASAIPDAPVALIDSRPLDEYSGKVTAEGVNCPGHIAGATNVYWRRNITGETSPTLCPADALTRMYTDAGVKPGDLVVTYCRTGGPAAFTYFVTKYLGYDTRYYDGSFIDWCNSKGQVASGYGRTAAAGSM